MSAALQAAPHMNLPRHRIFQTRQEVMLTLRTVSESGSTAQKGKVRLRT
jgi:hypothetical protein